MDITTGRSKALSNSQKRMRAHHEANRSKFEEETTRRDTIVAVNAKQMAELAEKALVAVQEMMALESATRKEAGCKCGVFTGDDDFSLGDAERAISATRYYAEKALKK
jgi:hypothetical protein